MLHLQRNLKETLLRVLTAFSSKSETKASNFLQVEIIVPIHLWNIIDYMIEMIK